MSQQVDPPPVAITPPGPVRAAGVVLGLQSLGLVAMAVVTLISGLGHDAALGQLLAQCGYFLVLAVFLAAVAAALLRGRRWGRTPAVVVQIIVGAIGFWLAVPSGRVGWGLAMILLAVVTGYLLVSPAANEWIKRFPPLFGPEPGR